jgi:uridine phosphorylase
MPYLRPSAELAPDALLPGDPGRALMLAQEVLEEPRMTNHARGLWGYTGRTAPGALLTVQSTGIGAPSATAVMRELAAHGLRRAIRIGTCVAISPELELGELLVVDAALGGDGVSRALGMEAELVAPDATLLAALRESLDAGSAEVAIASFDLRAEPTKHPVGENPYAAADLQTAALYALGRTISVAVAAVLVVAEAPGGELIADDALERAVKRAGHAAVAALAAAEI